MEDKIAALENYIEDLKLKARSHRDYFPTEKAGDIHIGRILAYDEILLRMKILKLSRCTREVYQYEHGPAKKEAVV